MNGSWSLVHEREIELMNKKEIDKVLCWRYVVNDESQTLPLCGLKNSTGCDQAMLANWAREWSLNQGQDSTNVVTGPSNFAVVECEWLIPYFIHLTFPHVTNPSPHLLLLYVIFSHFNSLQLTPSHMRHQTLKFITSDLLHLSLLLFLSYPQVQTSSMALSII